MQASTCARFAGALAVVTGAAQLAPNYLHLRDHFEISGQRDQPLLPYLLSYVEALLPGKAWGQALSSHKITMPFADNQGP